VQIAWQLAQLNPAIGTAVALYNIAHALDQGKTPSLWDIAGALPAVGIIGREASALARTAGELSEIEGAYAAASKGERAVEAAADVERSIGATGEIGESMLAQLGGTPRKFFDVPPFGARFVDMFANGVAHESKVGYVAMDTELAHQISKDAILTQVHPNEVKGVVWHFFQSPVTGKGGPSGPVRDALRNAGVTIVYHPPLVPRPG
jgi:hypothetical protein